MTQNVGLSSETERAWGGEIMNVIQTERNDNYKFKAMEISNVEVLKMVFGDSNVTGTLQTGITIQANAKEMGNAVYVIEMIEGHGTINHRFVIPIGRISEIAETVYKSTESVGYDVTITAQADTSGNSHYEYKKAV